MNFLYGETVTVTRPADRDEVGDPTAPPTSHELGNVAIAWGATRGSQATTSETDRRQTTVTRAQLYCQPGADIQAFDRVRLTDGNDYLVDGQPVLWKSPWDGWQPGVVVELTGVK